VTRLFDAALNLTFTEDRHFGHPKRMTLSQRDVPGLTRAVIPLLSRAGVKVRRPVICASKISQCTLGDV
jgi:hypothetical protein